MPLLFPALWLLMVVAATGMEHVVLQRDGQKLHVRGRVVLEAQDGGLLVLAPDGVLWAVPPDQLIRRRTDDDPFRVLDRKSLQRSLLEGLPEGFSIYSTAHYVICYNTTRAYAQWCGALYERLYRGFYNYWERRGLRLRDPELPLVALVFDSRDSYGRYARTELGAATDSIIGYYSLRTNRVTTYDLTGVEGLVPAGMRTRSLAHINRILSQPKAERMVATLIHEATHQLAFNCGLHERYADIPMWLSEGLAVYFETPDLKSAKGWRTIGAVNRVRLQRLRQYLHRRPEDSLQQLLSRDDRLRDSEQALDAYAESWALCYFLIRRYPEQFVDYLRALSAKKPLREDDPENRLREFRAALGVDLAQLDREFLSYVRRLRKKE